MILHNFDNSANNGGLLSKIGINLNGIPKTFTDIGRESAEAFSQSFDNGFSLQGLKSLPKNLKESLSVPITNVEDLYKRNFVFTDNVTPFLKNEDVFKNFDDEDLLNNLSESKESFMSFLDEVDLSGDIFQQYQEHLQQSANGMSLFGHTTKVVGSALKTLGATLGSMAIMRAIGEAISLATTAIDNYANRVKYAKEALDDFNSSTKEQQDNLSSQKA